MPATPWESKPLVLPISGKDYAIQPMEYNDGLTLVALSQGRKADIAEDASEEELFKLCMGDVRAQMLEDKVPYPALFRAAYAAVVYQQALVLADLSNDDAVAAAEKAWERGIDPEAIAAALTAAQEQTGSAGTSTNSTSSAPARKTPSRASGRTTKSPTTTPRIGSKAPAKKAARRSPRTPSSTSGS